MMGVAPCLNFFQPLPFAGAFCCYNRATQPIFWAAMPFFYSFVVPPDLQVTEIICIFISGTGLAAKLSSNAVPRTGSTN
jgi:hypothetical protein